MAYLSAVPNDWQELKIDKLSSKVGSGVTPRGGSSAYSASGIKFIRSQNVHFSGLKLRDVVYVSQEIHESMSGSKLKGLDVLLNITGASIGRCTFVPKDFGEANVNQHVCIIRPNEKVDSVYLSQWFASDSGQDAIMKYQAGGNREGLNFQQIRSMAVTLPPLSEQQKIAAILTSVDEVVEKTQAQIDKLKDLKSGMMQELLTKGVGIKQGGKYVPHTEFKDYPVGKIPKSWKVVTLGEVSSLITKGATPTTSGHRYAVKGTRFYRSVNASEHGDLLLDDIRYISIEANKQLKRSSLERGDVVLSIVGAKTGRTYFFIDEKSPLPANINQNIALIRANKERLYPEFLKFFISSNIFLQQLDREITTQAQPSLSLKQVGDFITPLPSLDEQIEIAQYMSSITKHLIVKYKKLAKLENTKKALMQDLLTGKVRVKVNNDLVS